MSELAELDSTANTKTIDHENTEIGSKVVTTDCIVKNSIDSTDDNEIIKNPLRNDIRDVALMTEHGKGSNLDEAESDLNPCDFAPTCESENVNTKKHQSDLPKTLDDNISNPVQETPSNESRRNDDNNNNENISNERAWLNEQTPSDGIESEDELGEFIGGLSESENDGEVGETIVFDDCNFSEQESSQTDIVRSTKRRRILIYNDGHSSGGSDRENEEFGSQSLIPHPNECNEIIANQIAVNNPIFTHERPGPKSKKQSTQLLKELQARALLQSAIVIPAPTKKKQRIIDSEDETENETADPLHHKTSIDDIGVLADGILGDIDDGQSSSILIDVGLEPIEIDEIKPASAVQIKKEISSTEIDEDAKDLKPVLSTQMFIKTEPEVVAEALPASFFPVSPINPNLVTIIKSESPTDFYDVIKLEPIVEIIEKTASKDSGNSSDSTNKRVKSHKTTADDFDKSLNNPVFSSSTSEEEFIPNEQYFGTNDSPDFPNPPHRRWAKRRNGTKQQKTTVNYESSSSDDCTFVCRTTNIVSPPNRRRRKKSRHMPNEIYFGDVKVPLHVLYSYDNSSSESDENRTTAMPKQLSTRQPVHKRAPITPKTTSYNSRADEELKRMKKYLAAAGIKPKFGKLFENCKTYQQQSEQILRLLHEKGLQGEPTMEKCKQLRKELRVRREAEGLDPNAIIPVEGEGRPRRNATRSSTNRNYTDPEEAQDTLRKLKNVIDSDSISDYD